LHPQITRRAKERHNNIRDYDFDIQIPMYTYDLSV
jgi:hypothetical protein